MCACRLWSVSAIAHAKLAQNLLSQIEAEKEQKFGSVLFSLCSACDDSSIWIMCFSAFRLLSFVCSFSTRCQMRQYILATANAFESFGFYSKHTNCGFGSAHLFVCISVSTNFFCCAQAHGCYNGTFDSKKCEIVVEILFQCSHSYHRQRINKAFSAIRYAFTVEYGIDWSKGVGQAV